MRVAKVFRRFRKASRSHGAYVGALVSFSVGITGTVLFCLVLGSAVIDFSRDGTTELDESRLFVLLFLD